MRLLITVMEKSCRVICIYGKDVYLCSRFEGKYRRVQPIGEAIKKARINFAESKRVFTFAARLNKKRGGYRKGSRRRSL
jgi:hypothetical protein